MPISTYLLKQASDRKELLTFIHEIIIKTDRSVHAEVGKMMGKEMMLYKSQGMFKYGLSAVKNYMSLPIMPIYGSQVLHSKYKSFYRKLNFKKVHTRYNKLIIQRLYEIRRFT